MISDRMRPRFFDAGAAARAGVLLIALALCTSPGVAQERPPETGDLAKIAALLDAGKVAEAYDALQRDGVKADTPAWHRLVGRVQMGRGRPEQAVANFSAVTKRKEATATDYRNLAWAQFEAAGRVTDRMFQKAGYVDAAAAAERATKLDPGFRSAWEYRVAALDCAGYADRTVAAIDAAAIAIANAGGDSASWVLFTADYVRRLRGIDAAIMALNGLAPDTPRRGATIARLWRDAGRVDKATAALTVALMQDAGDQAALEVLWQTFGAPAGNPPSATETSGNPSGIGTGGDPTAAAAAKAAKAARAARAKPGIQLLEKVIETHPKSVFARAYLGNLCAAIDDYTAAEAAYQACLEVDAKYSFAHRALGDLYRRRADETMRDPKYDRDVVRADFQRAVDAWLRYFETAGATNAVDPATIPRVDFLIYEQSRVALDPEAAHAAFVTFRERFPSRSDVEHTYSLICQDLGKFDEALAAMKAAIERCPDPTLKTRYVNNRGLLYEAFDRYDEARTSFEEAAKMTGPGKLDALENLGKLHYKLGSLEKARAYFKQVLDLDAERTASIFYYHLCRRRLEREINFRRR